MYGTFRSILSELIYANNILDANLVTFEEYSHTVCLDTWAEKDYSFSEERDSWMRLRS